MTGMNQEVREAVKAALRHKGLSQAELARRLGMERANLHRLLSGKSGQVPDAWQKILNELELQLVAVPLSGEIDLDGYREEQAAIDRDLETLLDTLELDEAAKRRSRPLFRQAIEETVRFAQSKTSE